MSDIEEVSPYYSKISERIFFEQIFSEENILFETTLNSNLPNFAIEEDNSKALITNEHISINPTKASDKEKSIKNRNELYPIDSIIDILRLYMSERDIKKILDKKGNIEHSYQYMFICKNKKIKGNLENNFTKIEIMLKKRERGRKPEKIGNKTNHDKWTPDNILRKIKGKLINEYILTFLNKILKSQGKNLSVKLVKLNHKKFISIVQKKIELKYLYMTLEDLLSEEESNKSILEKLDKNDTINFVLNLTFNDFIDLFTHKQTIEEINYTKSRDNQLIKDNLPGVESMLADLLEEGDDNIDYSLLVIFYLFNLERSIIMKQDRKRKEKRINQTVD
jgi:hypothetical protein